MSADVAAGLIGALGGALIGGLTGVIGTLRATRLAQNFEQRRWEADALRREADALLRETDALLRGMDYLTGGTQIRNVGIGIIDGMFSLGQIPVKMGIPLALTLWNQLLYLCDDKNRLKPRHERNNAERLVMLVEKFVDHGLVSKGDLVRGFDPIPEDGSDIKYADGLERMKNLITESQQPF